MVKMSGQGVGVDQARQSAGFTSSIGFGSWNFLINSQTIEVNRLASIFLSLF
jgi:hypothetical protein